MYILVNLHLSQRKMVVSHAEVIRDRSRQTFVRELNKVSGGEKVLVVEKSLIPILDMTFKFSELENLVKVSRIIEWSLETVSQLNSSDNTVYVFLIRSMSLDTLPLLTSLGQKPLYRSCVFFVPSRSILGINRLEAVVGEPSSITINELPDFDAVMLETDLISLQLGVEGGPPDLIAKFLKRLEMEFGIGVGHDEIPVAKRKFRKINAIGPKSKLVCDLFLNLNRDGKDQGGVKNFTSESDDMVGISRVGGLRTIAGCLRQTENEEVDNLISDTSGVVGIDSVVLIDRETDLWSVLCSQFTYEALIDEKFGIENCRVKLAEPMTLTSACDPLFAEVRDVPVSQIGQVLSQKANYISECYKEKDRLKSISEIKDFMEKFKVIQAEHASLSSHVALATQCSDWARDPQHTYTLKVEDQIMSMSKPVGKIFWKLEKLIRRDTGLNEILRLLCLTSLVFGGKAMTSGGVDKVLKSIVNRFGPHVIKALVRLEKAGFLAYHNPGAASAGVVSELMGGASKSKWPKIREEFRLIVEGNNENMDPGNALAEAYSGYVPLSVRLVQLLNVSWKTCADKLGLLRGPAIEIVQECPIATTGGVAQGNTIYVAVVFVGGVTYGEVAALRKLSQLEGGKRKFVVITTTITNYSRVFDII